MIHVIHSLASTPLAVDGSTTIALDEQWLNLAISALLPLLVGVVTKRVTDSEVKRLLLLVFSIITGALTSIQANGGSFVLGDLITAAAISFATGQGSYTFVLKPSKFADKVSKVTDGVGLTIKADPTKVALEEGVIVPAPEYVPADEIVDTEGQQAEVIADAQVGDDPVEGEVPDDAGDLDGAAYDDEPVAAPAAADIVYEDEDPEKALPYDVDPHPEVEVIDPAALPGGTEAPEAG